MFFEFPEWSLMLQVRSHFFCFKLSAAVYLKAQTHWLRPVVVWRERKICPFFFIWHLYIKQFQVLATDLNFWLDRILLNLSQRISVSPLFSYWNHFIKEIESSVWEEGGVSQSSEAEKSLGINYRSLSAKPSPFPHILGFPLYGGLGRGPLWNPDSVDAWEVMRVQLPTFAREQTQLIPARGVFLVCDLKTLHEGLP